jgi:hypothetical protein
MYNKYLLYIMSDENTNSPKTQGSAQSPNLPSIADMLSQMLSSSSKNDKKDTCVRDNEQDTHDTCSYCGDDRKTKMTYIMADVVAAHLNITNILSDLLNDSKSS